MTGEPAVALLLLLGQLLTATSAQVSAGPRVQTGSGMGRTSNRTAWDNSNPWTNPGVPLLRTLDPQGHLWQPRCCLTLVGEFW